MDDCKKKKDDKIDLDTLWTRIDYYSKFRKILGCEYGSEASIQLHKAIIEAYSFNEKIDDVLIRTAKEDFTLKIELNKLCPGDTLISFNWDTLAETIAMNMLGINLVQVPCPYNGTHIRLIKPHGSLSWIHKPEKPIIFQNGSKPRLDPMPEKDVNNDAEPLVLGAVPIKSELLEEIQKVQPGLHDLISAQWREVVNVISQAEEVVVIGYSFPKEDVYGRFLISEAVRRRTEHAKLKICYYSLKKDRPNVEEAFREIFGGAVNYEYKGKVKSAFKQPKGLPHCQT